MNRILAIMLMMPVMSFSQDSLTWFISKQMNDYQVAGLSIAIIKNNKLVYSKGFGVTRGENATPVDTSTIFPIMSCTKAFTATAIGILVDEGKMNWDDRVIKYLPDFKLGDAAVTKQLTVKDLLCHRSGLESYEGDLLWYGTNYTREEVVKRIQYSPLKNKFRNGYGYQNIMYLVAGQIIEKVSGRKWEDFVKEKIFTPLDLKKTITTEYLYNIAPAGAIQSNISDMSQWMKFWMNGGKHKDKRILSANAYAAITTPEIYTSDKKDASYGLGWQIETSQRNKIISHGGGMPGYKSLITIDIKNKNGVVILTNKISYLNEELAGIIFEYLQANRMNWQDKDKRLLTKNIRFGWDDVTSNYPPAHAAIEEYTGNYEDKQYGKTIVKKSGDTAVMEFLPATGHYKGFLSFINKDTLHIDFSDRFMPSGNLIFYRANNKIAGFKFDIPPGDFIFSNFNFKKN
jgi:CubicO group peptidase (beta-lactamase class C family)